jgi:hypothetical protein
VGAAVLVVATMLHPSEADPNDLPAALAEYAADTFWVVSHLGQFAVSCCWDSHWSRSQPLLNLADHLLGLASDW